MSNRWLLDGTFLQTKIFRERLPLQSEALQIRLGVGFFTHFGRGEFLFAELEVVVVMVGRDGIKPAPSNVNLARARNAYSHEGGGLRYSFEGTVEWLG